MKSLNEIEEFLIEKVAGNKKKIEEYTKKIQEVEQAAQKADADLTTAEVDVDVETYKKAKDSIWSAKHAKELYLKQIDKLMSEPLITQKEYQQYLADITNITKETHEEQNDRAAGLISELKDISEESRQTDLKANKLLNVLQREVFKEPEGSIPMEDGTTTWSTDKKYVNYETVHNFYQNKITGSRLEERAGRTEPQQTQKSWLRYK